MEKPNYSIKPVPMYDLFSKGNYVGSFKTKADVEVEILRRLELQSEYNRNLDEVQRKYNLEKYIFDMAFTTIRSTHYRLAQRSTNPTAPSEN